MTQDYSPAKDHAVAAGSKQARPKQFAQEKTNGSRNGSKPGAKLEIQSRRD
jgi:hypothetical protein